MNSILEETRFIMKKYNIKANKSLGQNFLISENVVQKIVESGEIDKEKDGDRNKDRNRNRGKK